ncbi:DUF1328 domain-containing protein [Paenibacillus darwinianus]|uniref:DUF1328 domain-containing protein n=1 Tax=Paenibacillus darwinianus TaxID=1380763 RepID=UPI0009DE8085|nr:DUF1328 domain-containing protein [Paenibacillus darwinianus]
MKRGSLGCPQSSIIAAIFGFGGIVDAAASVAKILFFVFLILFVVSLIFGRRSSL